jgi:hypothetical protein
VLLAGSVTRSHHSVCEPKAMIFADTESEIGVDSCGNVLAPPDIENLSVTAESVASS